MGAKPRGKAIREVPKPDLVLGGDGVGRCFWAGTADIYTRYHDDEWGKPTRNDTRLFEKICLEGFQAGLSWLTILRKREHFREVFADFDFHRVAKFGETDVKRLVTDPGIIRHRGKIESTINNAARALELASEWGSLAAYFWSWTPPGSERPSAMTRAALSSLAKTPTSTALSKDLRKRGWSFVGPTTAYAFMQAMGLVNDHLIGCPSRQRCTKLRAEFSVPTRG